MSDLPREASVRLACGDRATPGASPSPDGTGEMSSRRRPRAWALLRTILLIWILLASSAQGTGTRQAIRIGVLAHESPGTCHRRWGATADYLTSELDDLRFEIVPVSFAEVMPMVAEGRLDFLLANPVHLIQLVERDLCMPIATVKGRFYGGDYAGVIFWSARRFDIAGARDVRGRTVAAVSRQSLGGWLMQELEYKEAGIDVSAEAAGIAFLDSHEVVVRAVLAGEADLGFCRTGVLETMASRGEIELSGVRIGTDFIGAGQRAPRHHSTRLYPEWPLVALNHVPPALIDSVRLALLDMPSTDVAARDSHTAGWIPATNYGMVRRCLRLLGVPPFDRASAAPAEAPRYGEVVTLLILGGVFAVLVCAILFLRLRSLSHRLARELRHETVLGRSRSFLAAVVGSFPYPVVVIGLDYRVLLANPRARELYGWEDDDEGVSCHSILRGRDLPCHDCGEECMLRKIIDSGEPEIIQAVHRYSDGKEVAVRVHGMPLFGPDGRLHAVAEWLIDERDDAGVQTAPPPGN